MLANRLIPYPGLRRGLYRRRGHPLSLFDHEIEELFDRALRGFALPATDRDDDRTAWLSPRIDMLEAEDRYTVTAELPGLEEKELKVELSDGYLTIEGEKKAERDDDDKGGFHLVERSFGTFKRSLQVPADVDVEGIDAAFRNGVLTVALPKKEEAKATVRKIAVKAA